MRMCQRLFNVGTPHQTQCSSQLEKESAFSQQGLADGYETWGEGDKMEVDGEGGNESESTADDDEE